MQNIVIEKTKKQPGIELDYDRGQITFSGKSFLENPMDFYGQFDTWIDQYIASPKPSTTVIFKFYYINSGTAKWIIAFCRKLQTIVDNGKNLQVNWHYDDDDALDFGRKMQDILKLPISLIESSDMSED